MTCYVWGDLGGFGMPDLRERVGKAEGLVSNGVMGWCRQSIEAVLYIFIARYSASAI